MRRGPLCPLLLQLGLLALLALSVTAAGGDPASKPLANAGLKPNAGVAAATEAAALAKSAAAAANAKPATATAASNKPAAAGAGAKKPASPVAGGSAASAPRPAPVTADAPTAAVTPKDDATSAVVGAATKEEAVSAVVASLGKADDKEAAAEKFTPVPEAPKGGVRLVKDILTGKLKALPSVSPAKAKQAAEEAAKAKASAAKAAAEGGKAVPVVVKERMSAVVAAALAGKAAAAAAAAGGAGGASKSTDATAVAAPRGPVRPTPHHQRADKTIAVVAKGGASKEQAARTSQPMHLNLGCELARPTIVSDGVVQRGWNISESSSPEDVAVSLVKHDKDYSDFFLWRVAMEGDRPRRVITGQKPFVIVNNSQVVDVTIQAWGQRHMTPIPLTDGKEAEREAERAEAKDAPGAAGARKRAALLKKEKELLFGAQYVCKSEGRSLVTIVLRLFELTTGQRSTESIQWSFIKECKAPSASRNETNTEGNAAIPGLNIGSRRNKSDIVEHGEASPFWTLGQERVAKKIQIYDAATEGAKWWLRYEPPAVADAASGNLTVNKAVFLIDDPTVLMLEESGDLTEQSTLVTGGRTFTLAVTFTCKKAGLTAVTAVLNFPQGSAEVTKVSFSFLKQCAGLAVGDGVTMNGIDICAGDCDRQSADPSNSTAGSAPQWNEVAINGAVQPAWRPSQNESLIKAGGGWADRDVKHVSFFLKLRNEYHDVEYDPPVVESYNEAGEIILRPKIFGSIEESSVLKAGQTRFLILQFNCIKEGEAIVTIKLPLRPSGNLQWNMRKSCVVSTAEEEEDAALVREYSSGAELVPLPGINVGHNIDQDTVVRNGVPTEPYHWRETTNQLIHVGPGFPWINFFLWKNSSVENAKDVRFGRPELISTADILRPMISGLGAEGGLIADNEYSSLSVTFHCFTAGKTTISLVIPLVGDEYLSSSMEPVSIPPARSDPIRISFVKECPEAALEPVAGMGGVGIHGFSVGLSPNTSELVFNGLPTPPFFGQRNKLKPNWTAVIVPERVEATTLYVHYNSLSGKNQKVGKEVLFQAPIVVAHNPNARPTLAGEAADGGVLLRDGPALALDLTYHCRYAGLAVVTVVFPIVPHGQISVTIPKRCSGGELQLAGSKLTGLFVGTTKTGEEVVKDGQTSPSYVSVATRKSFEHKVTAAEEVTVFYLRKTGDPLRALEPLIFAHKPIVNVRVTHAMLLNSTEEDSDADGLDEIEINDQVSAIRIEYACVHPGRTDITISLNLLPKGQVQWTFEKQCDDVDATWSRAEHPLQPGGISPGAGEASQTDIEYERYRAAQEADNGWGVGGEVAGVHAPQFPEFGPGTHEAPDSFADPEESSSFAEYARRGAVDLFDGKGAKQSAEASITTPSDQGTQYVWNEEHFNPHSSVDHTSPEQRATLDSGLGLLMIGTGKSGDSARDVFHRSLPRDRYKMKTKASLDITQYAVIKPDQDSSVFFLSVGETAPRGVRFGKPSVALDKRFLSFLAPELTGSAAAGGKLAPGALPSKLELSYNCLKGGVFAVGVRVPLLTESGAETRQSALWRVVKICPNFEVHEEWYWTAGRVMSLMSVHNASSSDSSDRVQTRGCRNSEARMVSSSSSVVVLLFCACACVRSGFLVVLSALAAGFIMMRRVFQEKKALPNAMYVPVQTEQS